MRKRNVLKFKKHFHYLIWNKTDKNYYLISKFLKTHPNFPLDRAKPMYHPQQHDMYDHVKENVAEAPIMNLVANCLAVDYWWLKREQEKDSMKF